MTALKLNNVNIDAITGLVAHIQTAPQAAQTTWKIDVEWKGAFTSEARVRDFAPIRSDEPPALGGTDTAPNPVEQLLSALGHCLTVGYAANASVAGITIRSLRISLEGNIDLRTFLGLAQGNAGFEGITVRVTLDADATASQITELHRKVVGTSPVGHTLQRPVPVRFDLVQQPGN